jgi:hypothetical protein
MADKEGGSLALTHLQPYLYNLLLAHLQQQLPQKASQPFHRKFWNTT